MVNFFKMTEQIELRGIRRPLKSYAPRRIVSRPATVPVTRAPSGFPAYKAALAKRRKDIEAARKAAEAYEVLSNPEKKSRYDQFGHAAFEGGHGGFGGGGASGSW